MGQCPLSGNRIESFRLEKVTLFIAALILFYQVIIPPIIALADSGDYWRMMTWGGLQYQTEKFEDRYFFYINRMFSLKPETQTGPYFSSEVVFVEIGLFLNKILSKSGLFDLRVLGFVHLVFFLFSIYLILNISQKMGVPFRPLLAALWIFIFCDVGYISYFNSFYAEPATLIFLFLTFGLVLHLIVQRNPRVWVLLAFFLAALLFISAKPQNSPLGFLLAVFLTRLAFVLYPQWWKRTSVFFASLICIFSFLYYLSPPDVIKKSVLYNCVFYDILRLSPTPEKDLLDLGLKREFVYLKGTHAYMENAPFNDPEFRKNFFPYIGYEKILKFYLTHPDRLLKIMKIGAKNAFSLRPGYLGNFEKSEEVLPQSKSQAFAMWSNFKERYFPKSLWVLSGLFFIYISSIIILRARAQTKLIKLIAEWYLILVLMATGQFFISIISGGEPDLVKHLFLFNVLTDISIITIILVAFWVGMRIWQQPDLLRWDCLSKWIFWEKRKLEIMSFITMGIGIIVLLSSLFADFLGIGGYPGFGKNQMIGTIAGTVIIVAGFMLNWKYLRIPKNGKNDGEK